ncbi:hypothetical protein FRB99_006550 [Tulasnella sp. 403]|nr:hypothetical protein FRB99_006550 [Tulasnella sp. 403]
MTALILTQEVRLGILLVVIIGALSFLAVSSLLLYICYNAIRNRYWPPTQGTAKWHFIRSHVDYYFLSLLFSDFFMATGHMMLAAWVITDDRFVSEGTYCSVQAAMQHVGSVGMALATLAIAIHTFLVLVMRWRPSDNLRLPLAVVVIIWLFLLCAFVILGIVLDEYYGPTAHWCGIEARWIKEHVALEYSLYWVTAIVNICLYVSLFFCLRGNLKIGDDAVTPSSRAKLRIQWQWLPCIKDKPTWGPPEEKNLQQWIARQMLAYPIAYLFIITPISISGWMESSGNSFPHQACCFAAAAFASSGLVNTTLYLIIRPKLLQTLCGRRSRCTTLHAHKEVAGGAHPRIEVLHAEGDRKNDHGRRSYGLGLVIEQANDLEEGSNVGALNDSPLPVLSSGSSRSPEDRIPAHESSGARGTSTSGGSWVTSRPIV